MKTDTEIRKNVENALTWEPSVMSTHIGIAVDDGVVTLSGHVPSWDEKWKAERAAKRIFGVKALANEIAVDLPGSHKRSDTELAKAAVHALEWRTSVPEQQIKVTVKDGCVTLEGEVELYYQSRDAAQAIRFLTGVRRVTNNITVRTAADPKDVSRNIRNAFERSARLDAGRISVEIHGHKVTLRGTVPSWAEKDEAAEAAWAAAGVNDVDNQINVSYVI